MNRRRGGSLASSPLLIGAITTLIVVVAVYLSYNANNGLPFVPTYNIKVVLPQTSGLRVIERRARRRLAGGDRQARCRPIRTPPPGSVTAVAELKLEKGVEPLPVDTTASVQSLSSIGLKYLQLEKGTLPQDDQARAGRSRSPGSRTGEHRRTVQHVRRKRPGRPTRCN